MTGEVWLACMTHALSTETEEIMGLLLGDIQVYFLLRISHFHGFYLYKVEIFSLLQWFRRWKIIAFLLIFILMWLCQTGFSNSRADTFLVLLLAMIETIPKKKNIHEIFSLGKVGNFKVPCELTIFFCGFWIFILDGFSNSCYALTCMNFDPNSWSMSPVPVILEYLLHWWFYFLFRTWFTVFMLH